MLRGKETCYERTYPIRFNRSREGLRNKGVKTASKGSGIKESGRAIDNTAFTRLLDVGGCRGRKSLPANHVGLGHPPRDVRGLITCEVTVR